MLANAYAQILAFFQTYGVLAVLAVILAVGILRIVARYLGSRERARMARAFRERFQTFANSSGEDTEAYERLSFLAERMATAMGRHALVGAKPPFTGRAAGAYVTVLQVIPELRMHFANLRDGGYGLGNDGASWIYHTVDDALIAFLGELDGTANSATKKLINPIAWFREGVERILALPLYIAGWFGLIESDRASAAERHSFFRAVAGLAALIVVATIASVLIFGEQKTTAAYRSIGNTAGRTINGAAKSVVSAFSDAGKLAGQIGKGEEQK